MSLSADCTLLSYQSAHAASQTVEQGVKSRSGFTMVELVVGLVLLATLLVSMLMVISRQRRASRMASAKQEAVQAADLLLADWFDGQSGIPLSAQGRVAGTQLVWQTSVSRNVLVFEQPVPVVRLSIVQPFVRSQTAMQGRTRELANTELLSIELLAPQGDL
ncbi:MAG: prepilin-type N-terminal cleavage/methylation domain-containing protein [Aureliella sp.]